MGNEIVRMAISIPGLSSMDIDPRLVDARAALSWADTWKVCIGTYWYTPHWPANSHEVFATRATQSGHQAVGQSAVMEDRKLSYNCSRLSESLHVRGTEHSSTPQ